MLQHLSGGRRRPALSRICLWLYCTEREHQLVVVSISVAEAHQASEVRIILTLISLDYLRVDTSSGKLSSSSSIKS
jgi:hypothetical protein